MPVSAIAGVVVVVVILLVVLPLALRRAKSAGAQGASGIDAALGALGLRPVQQSADQARYEGEYRGRRVVMETDASAITKATQLGGALTALGGVASAAGVGVASKAISKGVGMSAATGKGIKLTWTATLASAMSGQLTVTRAPAEGLSPWGNGMHAAFDPSMAEVMADPNLQAALAAARFHKVTASGQEVQLAFTPSLSEYTESKFNTPAGMTALARSALDAVSVLSDRIGAG